MQIDVFKDFTKTNILNWLAQLWLFLTKPRDFLRRLIQARPEVLFSQYLFYFICYTFSYLLTSTSNDFNNLVRPSIIDLFFCVPVLLLFMLSCKIVTGKTQFKALFLFVVTLYMIFAPVNLFFTTLFLQNESYLFLIIKSLLTLIFLIYLFYGFGFIIQTKFFKGLTILMVNMLLAGGVYMAIDYISLQLRNGGITMADDDFIYQDYKTLMAGMKHKTAIPIEFAVMHENKRLKTYYGIQDVGVNSAFIIHPDTLEIYQLEIKYNIAYLKAKIPQLKFNRNKEIAQSYLDYNERIFFTMTKSYFNNKLTALDDSLFNNKIPGLDLKNDLSINPELISLRESVKDYNNQIVKLHRVNQKIITAQTVTVFLAGMLINGMIQPEKIIIPNEPFMKLDAY